MKWTCYSLTSMLLLSIQACKAIEPLSESKFFSAEHAMIGDWGYQEAIDSYVRKKIDECPRGNDVDFCYNRHYSNSDSSFQFSYGEIVAFSGDFFEKPEPLFNVEKVGVLKFQRQDIVTIKKNFIKEKDYIDDVIHGDLNGKYPDTDLMSMLAIPEYLSLAITNTPHFGFNNIKHYVKYHKLAMNKALEARENKDINKLREAIFYNGFADHFLTDGFASGHIRVPRQQIYNWMKSQNLENKSEKDKARMAGTLSRILHDKDGEVRESGAHGMAVKNSRGDEWFARCDSQLFWDRSLEGEENAFKVLKTETVLMPIRAVQASVIELFDAYYNGKVNEGIYEAIKYIPFPTPSQPDLVSVFPSINNQKQLDKIMEIIPFYAKNEVLSGVNEEIVKEFLKSLPEIMKEFRNQIKNDVAQNQDNFVAHLPKEYLEAYTSIK